MKENIIPKRLVIFIALFRPIFMAVWFRDYTSV